MNKLFSRMLSLLMAMLLLFSGVASAFAEGVTVVGDFESIEQMVFDKVKAEFASADLETQYIYAVYYENQGKQALSDELLATLTDEQRIEFVNWRVEHNKCIDGCGGASGCTMIDCACVCHKVEAFTKQMNDLIKALNDLDMEEAKAYIYSLRQHDLHMALYKMGLTALNPVSPDVTPGHKDYEIGSAEPAVMMLALDDETEALSDDTDQTPAQKLLSDYNALDGNGSSIDDEISDTLQAYAASEASYASTYSVKGNNFTDTLNSTDANAGIALLSLEDAVSGDIMPLAEDQSQGIHVIDTAEQSDNIHIEVFNYTADYLKDHYLKFQHSGANYGPAVDGPSTNSGTASAGTNAGWIEMNPLLANGYPETKDGNSLDYLFNNGARKGTMNGNSKLFQKKGSYYVYDSMYNAAWFNGTNFTLYSNPVCPAYSITGEGNNYTPEKITDVQAGNFLPFNRIIEADGTVNALKYGTSSEGVDRYRLTTLVDMWFGLYMNADYVVPKDGQVDGEDMVFEFLGDDDVWVYIDDVLVLDIGGTHGSLAGTINFSNGVVTYANSGNTDGVTTTLKDIFSAASVNRAGNYTWTGNRFADYTELDIKFYYLERGGNISYCKMFFNLPVLPKGGLTVGKDIASNETDLITDTAYSFKLEKDNGNGTRSVIANQEYEIVDSTETGTTNEEGVFTLKPGQKAHFSLESKITYYVTELDHAHTDNAKWIVDNQTSTGKEASVYVEPEEDTIALIQFVNTLKKTELKVEKKVENGRPSDLTRKFKFEAQVNVKKGETTTPYISTNPSTGYNVDPDTGKISFELADGESLTITDLPIGATVTVAEVDSDIANYDTVVTGDGTLFVGAQTGYSYTGVVDMYTTGENDEKVLPTVTFTNTPNLYPLTITKTGLDLNIDPNSSTMYKIENKTGTDPFELIVSINGNESTTVVDVPCGEYTITELNSWSWRYEPKESVTKDATISAATYTAARAAGLENVTVTFENDRKKIYWLDGENYKENLFNGDAKSTNEGEN